MSSSDQEIALSMRDVDGATRSTRSSESSKRAAVNALKSLNYRVIAAGDSFNDTGMLSAADTGFFIHPPAACVEQFPQFAVTRSYAELMAAILDAAARAA